MISMIQQSPVRPLPPDPPDLPGGDGEAAPAEAHGDEEQEEIDPKLAFMDDPIVGVESKSTDPQTPQAKPLPTPPAMTQAEKDKHDLTHQPPHRGCAICAASRAPNTWHVASHEHLRTIPLLVGDYCFMRSSSDSVMLTCLVMRLYPYRLCLACGVTRRGTDPSVISRTARLINESCLDNFAYRCERENH